MNRDERLLLIDELIEGTILAPDRLRIEAELIIDPQVRQEYYRRLQLDMLLRSEASRGAAPENTSGGTVAGAAANSFRPVHWVSAALLAVAAMLLLVLAIEFDGDRSETVAGGDTQRHLAMGQEEPSASGFAVVDGQADAIWEEAAFANGDLLPGGELHLRSGRARIEFFSGVEMVLEGESRFSIDSSMQVTLFRGRARTRVPEPAQGFRVKTSSGDVIDLGTEFSVAVDEQGSDVYVVDGEVELHPTDSDALRIDAGQARRLDRSGGVTEVSALDESVLGPHEFQNWLRQQRDQRHVQWQAATEQLRGDQRTLAYYQFHRESRQSRRIENLATGAADRATDGTIVATTPATDRWGRSDSALDFSRVGSRVRVRIPGEHRGLTLMCWVKINSLDRWYNSLFLTDGHDEREPHWQIMDDGRIFFSVKVPSRQRDADGKAEQPIFYSPSIWDASLSGRWIMLAVTYDVDRAEVTHYLNGQPISSEPIAPQALVESIQIGTASICNWSEPKYQTDPRFVLRNLNGSMDEMSVMSGALSANEIIHWYQLGSSDER
ncbi:LamG-like jellyroll fold domain-containing protein [Allorhodopirellula solitaria]|uniref:FecR protein n=1 Tax=Allorhodopirellula solitaria TaxID=2527987 RepID=A0A5C5XSA3_9BACT|nr:LamG-like jellyroll fold domain-containing protein [Allorhodopirellula solitaria]TWT66126.1 FecR protein [Allorhodopirellula solitaria]